MYIGGVRFFKHLIYLTLIIITLLVLLGIKVIIDTALLDTSLSNDQENDTLKRENDADISEAQEGAVLIAQDNATIPDVQENFVFIDIEAETDSEGSSGHETEQNVADPLQKLQESIGPGIEYQSLYPDLYNEIPVIEKSIGKNAYLTFDDGPSSRTLEILDILRERDIKATFFIVSNNNNLDILKRIVEEGHTIGIHSHSHNYNGIYKSVEAFLDDFNTCYNKIYEATSVKPEIFRFPGGSINAHNMDIYQEIISEMLRRGFLFYDWNASTQDTVKDITPEAIVKNVKDTVKNQENVIILGHDSESRYNTVKALPEIIDYLQEKGYTLNKLDNTVAPIVFAYQH
ncbi:MAG TPA: polysaccharide deacetylase family protein [Sedimentibacter sp.]|nr:polysaccharide deacetylase family protein [Sedimentibacter sp.]